MAAAHFGYVAGDGSGAGTVIVNNFLGVAGSAYTNNTGSTVYVDTINLVQVAAGFAGVVQLAIYDDHDLGYPLNLLATTVALTVLTAGTNSFALIGDPLAVGPGVSVMVLIRATAAVIVDGAVAANRISRGAGGGATAFPAQQFANPGLGPFILPVVLVGDTIGPGDPTNAKAGFVSANAVNPGAANMLAGLAAAEAVSGGVPSFLAGLVSAQALIPVVEGGEMATDELKFSMGVAWEAKKRIIFSSALDQAQNLREVTAELAAYPVYEFEVSFPFLPSGSVDAALQATALKYCEGFFKDKRGRARAWLFRDPEDNAVNAGPMIRVTDGGIGANGVETDFWLAWDTGGQFQEPIGQVNTAAGYRIDVNGAAVAAADYTLLAPNRISFDAAPADGALPTWTGEYFFVCRFIDDVAEFGRFNGKLWEWQQVGFRSQLQ